jgi:hypothetical protein
MRCIEFLRLFFSEFRISESEFRFLDFSTAEFKRKNSTGIFGIKNGIRTPLPMGVPEIGTKNRNSQPRVNMKEVDIEWCPTKEMVADFMTKPLQGSHFRRLCDLIMGMASIKKAKNPHKSKTRLLE